VLTLGIDLAAGHAPLLAHLTAAAPWLDLGPFDDLCRRSHDA